MINQTHLAILQQAEVLYGQGKLEEAVVLCDQVLAQDPESAAALNLKGTCLGGLDRLADALVCFKLARLYLPINTDIRYNLGKALELTGDRRGALAEYDEALRLDGNHASARWARGLLHSELGHDSEALADMDEHLRRNPQDAKGWMIRGGYHMVNRRFALAHADLLKALEIDPTLQAEVDRLINGCLPEPDSEENK